MHTVILYVFFTFRLKSNKSQSEFFIPLLRLTMVYSDYTEQQMLFYAVSVVSHCHMTAVF